MRFLFTRRWLLFAVVVAGLAYGCYLLGQWQFHRLAAREAYNARTERNLHEDPVPVREVLDVGQPPGPAQEWRRVRATGTYDAGRTLRVLYQSRDGRSGVDVVVPLRTADGAALLVDRGWVATDNSGNAEADVPPPPTGRVSVVGWVRLNGGSGTEVADGATRSVSSATIGPTLPYPVYGGYVDARKESPAPGRPPLRAEAPDLGNGPHFFYGLQWWFFGVLAVFGFGYLAWDEQRKRTGRKPRDPGPQSERSMPPSTGTIAPVTNDAAGESRNAATRPNSAGSP